MLCCTGAVLLRCAVSLSLARIACVVLCLLARVLRRVGGGCAAVAAVGGTTWADDDGGLLMVVVAGC